MSLRSSRIVKTKASDTPFIMYMSAQPLPPRGFRYGYRRYKGNTFILKTTLFGWQNLILRSDLTLLNTNISKKSTFV